MSALQIPKWEWEDLINQFHAFKAEDRMHLVYASSLGFNGGEASQQYLKNLESIIESVDNASAKNSKVDWRTAKGKDFQNLENYGDDESLESLDKFFAGFAI